MSENELEEKYNTLLIDHENLKKELQNTKDELQWMKSTYQEVISATFTDLFRLCGRVLDNNIYNMLKRRNSELTK